MSDVCAADLGIAQELVDLLGRDRCWDRDDPDAGRDAGLDVAELDRFRHLGEDPIGDGAQRVRAELVTDDHHELVATEANDRVLPARAPPPPNRKWESGG